MRINSNLIELYWTDRRQLGHHQEASEKEVGPLGR
jgi:hypothetical protein